MSSDLEIAVQYVDFILRWFLGWLWDCPQVLAILLISSYTTLLAWRLLSTMKPPALLTSTRTSLFLLLLLLASLLHCHSLSSRLVSTQGELKDAQWSVREGRTHRLELLHRLAARGEEADEGAAGGEREQAANPLDGCLHVFLDLGANRGLQIRKLYEPHLFPLAPILPLYTRYFGIPEERKLQEICSVAFEPNPRHAEHLQGLAATYATCGITVVVHNHTGVGHRDTTSSFAPFNTLLGHEVGQDASARLIHEDESVEGFMESHFHEGVAVETVQVVRFAKYITDVVATRRLPTSAGVTKPRVVIKADIEGAELKIIPDMVVTGAFGHVDNLHMEWHGNASYRQGREAAMISKLAPAITALSELTVSEGIEHQFAIEEMDDETYTGLLIYKPWGDYSQLPAPSC